MKTFLQSTPVISSFIIESSMITLESKVLIFQKKKGCKLKEKKKKELIKGERCSLA